MELQEFIQNFSEIFDDADSVNWTKDTYFKELDEYGSLTILSIIAFADEYYDVPITGKEIRETETVEDLFELIKNKL